MLFALIVDDEVLLTCTGAGILLKLCAKEVCDVGIPKDALIFIWGDTALTLPLSLLL